MWKRAAIVLAVLVAGCGDRSSVEEKPLVVDAAGDTARGDRATADPDGSVRIVVVTHGQASSPFWAIVRNGVEAARRQVDAVVDYRAPDVYSLERMVAMIDAAVADAPDGLVVSLPESGLGPAVRRATRAGIPTVTINSGSDAFRRLGALAHVGQPEDVAGYRAGKRLARAGVRRALCVNQQVGNVGLDARCEGLARAMREAGGSARVIPVDDQSGGAAATISAAVGRERADGVLTLNATSGVQAVAATAKRDAVVATFDLGPEVLEAVRRGKLLFAVDQQAYLQGYLPVVALAQNARYGLFPGEGTVIPTGPRFVTREDAAKVIELSRRSIR